MKRARKIICIAIIAVIVAVLIMCNSINANAYEVKLSANSTVDSGKTFTVTMKLSDIASMMNAKLTYDPNLFSYKGHSEINGLQVNEPQKGTIAFLYYVDGEGSLDAVSFNFEAQTVSEEKTGNFTIGQDIAIVTNDKNLNYTNIKEGSNFECSVTVKPKQQEIEKDPVITPSENISLNIGETKKLTADKDVTWSSSDNTIATVDENGNVKGIKEGTVTITAKDKKTGKSTSVTVKVNSNGGSDNPNPSAGAPVITPSGDVNLKIGDSQQRTANQDVTWKSSDDAIVTVDSTGKITAVGKGTAIIIATNSNGESTSFTVTVDDSGSSNNGGNSDNDSNNGSGNGSNNASGNGSNNGSGNGSNSGSGNGSNNGSNGSSTGGTSTSKGNSSSTANGSVPATGESSVGTIAILAIVTLIIGSIIFRRKSKIK